MTVELPFIQDVYSIVPAKKPKRWYVVWTNPLCEDRAKAGLVAQGYEVFLPKLRKSVVRHRKKADVEASLFPRYLFVAMDDTKSFYPIRATDGVSSLLNVAGAPLQVPDRVMGKLVQAEAEGLFDLTRHQEWLDGPAPEPFAAGTKVRIVDGPLTSFVAIILSAPNGNRALVLFSMFGRQSKVEMDVAQLERV